MVCISSRSESENAATPGCPWLVQKDVGLKNCTDEGWRICITNCRQNGDNLETKTAGADRARRFPAQLQESRAEAGQKSFQSFSRPARICNTPSSKVPKPDQGNVERRRFQPAFFQPDDAFRLAAEKIYGQMKKKPRQYEPHLVVEELSLLPGAEWLPASSGWSLMQVCAGSGYCLQAQGSTELETGAVLLVAGLARTIIRASQLGKMSLHVFNVIPARLTGLITLGEQDFLKLAAAKKEGVIRILSPDSETAVKMKELCANHRSSGLMFRLKLIQLFVEALGCEMESSVVPQEPPDAKARLRSLLQKTPPSELAELSFSELARRTNCTPRHLSRTFHELVGISFSDQRAEIRMARARELLATSNSKVVEVALESGYKSLSMFNLMFTRRFGTSPGRWRQKNGAG
jgi:AraC-like DNA-binding protein